MLIFRLLQAASLAYLCSFLVEMVSCQSLSAGLEKGAPEILKNHTPSKDIRRTYKLYNQCSSKHLQMIGKSVNARGLPNSPNVNLSFVSVHTRHNPNAMNIVGQKSGRFLCFNKRGKLIARFNGRKKLCLFKEDFSEDHYTVLNSLYNTSWYVGFNRKGKPLKGNQYSKSKLRDCFHFVKRDHSYVQLEDSRRPWPGPPIKDPTKLRELLTGRTNLKDPTKQKESHTGRRNIGRDPTKQKELLTGRRTDIGRTAKNTKILRSPSR